MRTRIARLHGGQLIMLLAALTGLGSGATWMAGKVLDQANAEFQNAYRLTVGYTPTGEPYPRDSGLAELLMANGSRSNSIGLGLLAAGVLLWLAAVVMLWVWFGTRRRPSAS